MRYERKCIRLWIEGNKVKKILKYHCDETMAKILANMKQKVTVVNNLDDEHLTHLIRYGNTQSFDNADITYNWSSAILNTADKIDARRTMRDAGVKIPKTVLPDDVLAFSDRLSLCGKWIARPEEHFGGSNFEVVKNSPAMAREFLNNGWYLSRIFKKERELRIHCAHGRVLLIHDKGIDGRTLNSNTHTTADWTVLEWDDYPLLACQEALKACDALGLDWGGVDVLTRGDDCVVLEVNTAPSVPGKIGPIKYARYFDWLLSSNTRRKHFNWTTIKNGYDMPWNSEELRS